MTRLMKHRSSRNHVAILAFVLVALAAHSGAHAAAAFVQQNYATPQTPQTQVNVTLAGAQTAGNLNVVVVGWGDSTSAVSTVSDFSGNVYQLAVGPTVYSGKLSQAIYFSSNIRAAAANANTISVTFTAPATFPDIRVLEYSGISTTNPMDAAVGTVGSSTAANSGSASTTHGSDLIFGAATTVESAVAGAGFNSRVVTSPDSDIAEDKSVTAQGMYSASAAIGPTGAWVMQMVAFEVSTVVDTQAPTAPGNLSATASGSQISLTWTASTDNVGVTAYFIERCKGTGCSNFQTLAEIPPGTSYSDTAIAVSSTYIYRMRATDGAGNLSPYSATATATTSSTCCDTQAPTAPSSLSAVASGAQIILNWTASTDNVGVTAYSVERCSGTGCSSFVAWGTTSGSTTFTDSAIAVSTTYVYRVRASDAAGNFSAYSNTATVTTSSTCCDTQAPTAPTALGAIATGTEINLSWTASTDNVGVSSYQVQRCAGSGCSAFLTEGAPVATNYTDAGLSASTSYSYRVLAKDAAGNASAYSNTATAVTGSGSGDTQAPSVPTGVTATASGSSVINLTWTASTDNVGVTGYRVERCQGTSCTTFAQIATPTTTSYSNTGLTASTSYSFRIRATDAAGNLSGYSSTATATTSASTDTQPPTAPTGVTATAVSGSQINLAWTASTDNVGVTGYRVERCQGSGCSTFAQVSAPMSLTYNDVGLSTSTSYSYRLRATDAAGNLSPYSSVVSTTTGSSTGSICD